MQTFSILNPSLAWRNDNDMLLTVRRNLLMALLLTTFFLRYEEIFLG
jgi:hypothetical protein